MMWCTFQTDATVFTGMPKNYITTALHHLIHCGMCIWIHTVGWLIRNCHVPSAAPTISEHTAHRHHWIQSGVADQEVPGPQCCSYHLWTHCTPSSLNTEWGGWSGSAMSPVLLLPSLNTLHTVITEYMLRPRINISWYCTFLTQKLDDAAIFVPVLHWATRCCAEITQSSMIMTCAFHGRHWLPLERHKNAWCYCTHISTIHVVCLFNKQPLYTESIYRLCPYIQCVHIYTMSTYTLSVHVLCKLCPQIHIYIFQHTIPWW